ncbi:coiled-coil domain-containing protein 50 isoform X1 [Scyliorhinus canicula]|uniref:coiled-coil domain-containing protein 50 isoform X1 n=1 Tax=Scyliorhinus canicula TaxID=7830 RepID=UPI0018F31B94|nr:coiled-coil domain-containing protein 50 isoform X1 [Scyliorhinus canicula]
MADFTIDQSSLPAVNAVCREFAVREDHSLAHNLQEQEIEHHLASNVQRNRLVQNDLQMAKKLQEEENKKAQARLQKQQWDMERRDNQIAQVIQDELMLENEKRRRQEEKDEAIARKLQEKEEKLRRKHQQEQYDGGSEENGDHMKNRVHKHDRTSRHGNDSRRNRDLRYKRDSEPKVDPISKSQIDDWATEPAAHGSREKLPPSDTERANNYPDADRRRPETRPHRKEAPKRPPPPVLHSAKVAAARYDSQGARPKVAEVGDECGDPSGCGVHCCKPDVKTSCNRIPETLGACAPDPEELLARESQCREDVVMARKERRQAGRSRSPDLRGESNNCQEPGMKPRMDKAVKETMHGISKMSAKDLEWKDAELARKLQEEELMAIQSSKTAAQMVQDEEIARLLMEEENKQSHRKSKEKDFAWRAEEDRRKGSSERRKHEQEKKRDATEYVRSKPREGPEQMTGKPERPGRPPSHREESIPQHPSRPVSKSSESSQKVSYYRQ